MENQQHTTTLCRAGCGFFGSPSTEGLCSKCYKDYVKRRQDTSARVSPTTMPAVVVSTGTSSSSSSSISSNNSGTTVAATAITNTATAAPATSSSAISSSSTTGCATVPDNTAATTSTVMIAEKLREVSCSQAAKSSEDMTAQMESAAASVEAAGGIAASSSATSSGALSTSRNKKNGPKHSYLLKGNLKNGEKGKYKSNSDEPKYNSDKAKHGKLRSLASLDTSTGPAEATNVSNEGQPITKKANRCHVCKKRVGLTGFVCRCGGLYCGEHRYDTAHGCSFDYKTMEREEIRKNNPVIVSEKIQRI